MTSKAKVFFIDGSSYVYRAFFAIRDLKTSHGIPTNAIYGFTNMLTKVIREHEPRYLAVVLDAKGPTFRHKVYEDYKANRPEMPDTLIPQIPWIKQMIEAFGIPILEKEGYEADDIIGTLAKSWAREGHEIVIVSGDKDLLQLLAPNIRMLDTMYDRYFDVEKVKERYLVNPEQLPDLFGLMGDSSDNIPGVPGIGEKRAKQLLEGFSSLEELLNHVAQIPQKHLREGLVKFADQAFLSKRLATIETNVELNIRLRELRHGPPDTDRLRNIFKELEFHRLLQEWSELKSIEKKRFQAVDTEEKLLALISKLRHADNLAVRVKLSGGSPITDDLLGLALSLEVNEAYYVPLIHVGQGSGRKPSDAKLERLAPFLEDPKIGKIGHHLKSDLVALRRRGIELAGLHLDAGLASYVLNPSRRSHALEDLSLEYLDQRFAPPAKQKGQARTFDLPSQDEATVGACEEVEAALQLSSILQPRIEQEGFLKLYFELEMPLISVLARMEMKGVRVDVDLLRDISAEMEAYIQSLEQEIHVMVGEPFNVNSPQQLAKVLFERLKLPVVRRTKTGYSTDMEVLEDLARSHDLPARVLDYRSLVKLKSTYVDVLPRLVHPNTERIHTSFNQTVTATGRLSSSEPNLQNIPIRNEFGRRIRQAFIADPGCLLLSADYSQVELRLLSHLSQDPILVEAFEENQDIHARTASEIFGVAIDEVTPQMRREAKVVNFGIIYGMSPYGLAKELKVDGKVAKAYIEGYFQRYKGVRKYIDTVLEASRETGFVETLMGRRRYLPEISGSNAAARRFAERTAINTSIQGTAADIIKKAMIRIQDRLDSEGLKSQMLIQVHDELLFEVPKDERRLVEALVREEMESVEDLSVPLAVSLGWGKNWAEAH